MTVLTLFGVIITMFVYRILATTPPRFHTSVNGYPILHKLRTHYNNEEERSETTTIIYL